ncbi:hypothetical protein LZ32DRAFT_603279 [Colletotrichum eremochloae]|nr:hypothetical protein LZ32DRAFT_603279 [Colletotrichum eremochloae]
MRGGGSGNPGLVSPGLTCGCKLKIITEALSYLSELALCLMLECMSISMTTD